MKKFQESEGNNEVTLNFENKKNGIIRQRLNKNFQGYLLHFLGQRWRTFGTRASGGTHIRQFLWYVKKLNWIIII